MTGVVLAFTDDAAALTRQSLRTAILGGRWPEGGRAALWALVDSLRPDDCDEVARVSQYGRDHENG